MHRKTLLTFVGLRDPYYHEPHDDGPSKGPVLAVLDARRFDRVILFSRPHRQDYVERTRLALRELHPKLQIEIVTVDIHDSTYHPHILAALRRALATLREQSPEDDYTISLLAGPPEIHACWVLLQAAGEFPARLVNYRRTSHNGLAGPRLLRELRWSTPLAAITSETLTLLAGRAARSADPSLQDPIESMPRHYFTRRTLEQAVLLGRHTAPALLTGEPGTQKHYLAALIHQLSPRHAGPLLILNCATLPESLFEAALFGEPGGQSPGKLANADGGTLVLLKIQKVPGPLLSRLIRAADEGRYYPPDSTAPVKVNVRLIGTTDQDLAEETRQGRFPEDVWRHLHAGILHLPALRERPDDIPLLAHDELERANRSLPREKRLSAAALAKLGSHHWPGNVSELERVINHAVVNSEQPTIQPADLDLGLGVNIANVFTSTAPRLRPGFSLGAYLRSVKRDVVRSALAKTNGNQSEAARLLGVTPQAISKLLRADKRGEHAPSRRKRR